MKQLMEHWGGRRMFGLIVVFCVGIVGFGVSGIAEQIQEQPRREAEFNAAMSAWSETLSLEIPAGRREGWRAVVTSYPDEFITACTVNP